YVEPLADLRMVLLRQRDPAAAKLPADDLEVVRQSMGRAQRIDNQPGSASYEQTVSLEVKENGRYALRVEGRVPDTVRPPSAPNLPANKRVWKCRPRIFVETMGGEGWAVFLDYATNPPTPGMPRDAEIARPRGR